MERRGFLKQCGTIGLSCIGLSLILDSCSSINHVTGIVNNNSVQLKKSEFVSIRNNKTTFRKYIIVRYDKSDYPIVVYRFSELDFKAMLLQCTHQGNELNVNGNLISCPAHGSEFTNKGEVIQGPAEQSLKIFPVTGDENNIYIQLI